MPCKLDSTENPRFFEKYPIRWEVQVSSDFELQEPSTVNFRLIKFVDWRRDWVERCKKPWSIFRLVSARDSSCIKNGLWFEIQEDCRCLFPPAVHTGNQCKKYCKSEHATHTTWQNFVLSYIALNFEGRQLKRSPRQVPQRQKCMDTGQTEGATMPLLPIPLCATT